MKTSNKYIKTNKVINVILFSAFLLFTMCVTLGDIIQPTTATVDTQITITAAIEIVPTTDDTQSLIFGFLAPQSWNAETGTTATYTSSIGNGTLSIAPSDEIAANSPSNLPWAAEMEDAFGLGTNTEPMKWVAFKSDTPLSGSNAVAITGEIQLTVSIGSNNLTAQLGYAAGLTGYGFRASDHDLKFGDDIVVTGQAFDILVTYKPATYTIDDVIKMTFDASKGNAELLDASQVYVCASAMVDGVQKEACDNSAALTMVDEGNGKWSLTFWAKNLFNAPVESILTDFNFKFTNEAGDISVQEQSTIQNFMLENNCD